MTELRIQIFWNIRHMELFLKGVPPTHRKCALREKKNLYFMSNNKIRVRCSKRIFPPVNWPRTSSVPLSRISADEMLHHHGMINALTDCVQAARLWHHIASLLPLTSRRRSWLTVDSNQWLLESPFPWRALDQSEPRVTIHRGPGILSACKGRLLTRFFFFSNKFSGGA